MDAWITCNEQMPTDGQTVLVTLNTHDGRSLVVKGVRNSRRAGTPWLIIESTRMTDDGSVLAWMPLPEPFQPKSGPVTDALQKVRDAGGRAWDNVADPDAAIRKMRGLGG